MLRKSLDKSTPEFINKPLPNVKLEAVKIGNSIEAITINLNELRDKILFIQPGITPPNEVNTLSEAYLKHSILAGCTGEAIGASKYICKYNEENSRLRSSSADEYVYILNGNANDKNLRAATAKQAELRNVIFISDPELVLQKYLGEKFKISFEDKDRYARFSLKINEKGNIESANFFDPEAQKTKAEVVENTLNEFYSKGHSIV
ncbi:MAG: hypothetical protein J0H68_03975 [Sphingobacteriia bacterium]|nr:hypothetical protein [Sphingobacteriia bacterium]